MSRGHWRRERKIKEAVKVIDAEPVLTLADIDPVITVVDGRPGITASDIELLPPSLRYQIEAVSRARRALRMPDNLRERQEAAVRRFKGDRPR